MHVNRLGNGIELLFTMYVTGYNRNPGGLAHEKTRREAVALVPNPLELGKNVP